MKDKKPQYAYREVGRGRLHVLPAGCPRNCMGHRCPDPSTRRDIILLVVRGRQVEKCKGGSKGTWQAVVCAGRKGSTGRRRERKEG